MKTSESIAELSKALSQAQKKIKSAVKDAENPYFRSSYATLASVWDACRDPLTDAGLSISQPISQVDGKLLVTTILMHQSGQFIQSECPIITTKQDMQSMGSAISYARRYSLAAIVGVTVDDDDGNQAVDPQQKPNPKPQQQKPIQKQETKEKPIEDIPDFKPTPATPTTPQYVIPFGSLAGQDVLSIERGQLVEFGYETYRNIKAMVNTGKLKKLKPETIELMQKIEEVTGQSVGLGELVERLKGVN